MVTLTDPTYTWRSNHSHHRLALWKAQQGSFKAFHGQTKGALNDVQLAVAPVFLLTAVAAMIGTIAGRLARIIDRARLLEDRIEAAAPGKSMTAAFEELKKLRARGRLVNICIALLTFCAILIGLTIMTLFIGETTEAPILRFATVFFLGGVSCFLLALICFLSETLLATRMLKFGKTRKA